MMPPEAGVVSPPGYTPGTVAPARPSGSPVAADEYRPRAAFLPFSPPTVGEEEIAAVVETLRSDWITTGPQAALFESEFAAAVSAPAALALNSCTAGLHTALAALGVGSGDEVVTTPLTFAATANVVEHLGARPVFVDVEPDTLNIDPGAIERAVNSRTRAILPVHFAGHPADMERIEDVARRHGLDIVEDAAHALPAACAGRPVGSARHATAFSFYATKNLTTAEGGMLTGDPDFVARCRVLALHGMSRDAATRYRQGGSWFYEVLLPGFKYNMTDVQASIGRCQLRRLPEFQRRRREIVRQYDEHLSSLDTVETPVARPGVEHAWHLYTLRLRLDALRIDRARFIEELAARNIGTSVHFIPVHLHPYYRDRYGHLPGDFPIALAAFERLVSLPLNPRLDDQDVADVVGAVHDVSRKFRR